MPGEIQVGVVTPKGTPVAMSLGYMASMSPPNSARSEIKFRWKGWPGQLPRWLLQALRLEQGCAGYASEAVFFPTCQVRVVRFYQS